MKLRKCAVYMILFCMAINANAAIDNVSLSDAQYAALNGLPVTLNGNDTAACRSLWKKDTALSRIPFVDYYTLLQIIRPVNHSIYKDSTEVYTLCKVIAKQLADQLLLDISSESADEKIPVAAILKFEKGEFFKDNMTSYFQNQVFDFYYNNKVMAVLHDAEYVKLLKPKALYKLLADAKTADRLSLEIVFIAHNSKYKLF